MFWRTASELRKHDRIFDRWSSTDSGRRTSPGVSYWKASSSSTRWPQRRNRDGTRVSTRNGSDTEKGNGGPVVDAARRPGWHAWSRVRKTPYLGRALAIPGAGERLLLGLELRSQRTTTTALFGELNARSIVMSERLEILERKGHGR